VDISTIAATDSSGMVTPFVDNTTSNTGISNTKQRVRIDVFCNPLEFTLSQRCLLGIIRKLSLADVVTTSSMELPPYRVINDLGVNIECKVSINNKEILSSSVAKGAQLPIEIGVLADAAINSNRARRRGSAVEAKLGKIINISFLSCLILLLFTIY
jgi:hypothetical protein